MLGAARSGDARADDEGRDATSAVKWRACGQNRGHAGSTRHRAELSDSAAAAAAAVQLDPCKTAVGGEENVADKSSRGAKLGRRRHSVEDPAKDSRVLDLWAIAVATAHGKLVESRVAEAASVARAKAVRACRQATQTSRKAVRRGRGEAMRARGCRSVRGWRGPNGKIREGNGGAKRTYLIHASNKTRRFGCAASGASEDEWHALFGQRPSVPSMTRGVDASANGCARRRAWVQTMTEEAERKRGCVVAADAAAINRSFLRTFLVLWLQFAAIQNSLRIQKFLLVLASNNQPLLGPTLSYWTSP
ncbi:hypothetical protein C8R45DRAFT_1081471 [Mycena sanguinolenta]|nr:hypothetical protein C8R45DRAFT_1081471 [Mycena sanguinolenta]